MLQLLSLVLLGQIGDPSPRVDNVATLNSTGDITAGDDLLSTDDVTCGDEVTADAITLDSTVAACLDAVTCIDASSDVGGQMTGTTDPSGRIIRPGVCAPGDGTCLAANLGLFGGQDTSIITIDAFGSCAGDTVTVYVWMAAGVTPSTTILTEGVTWTASGSNGTTATSLAAAVEALSGVGATASSSDVRITLDSTAGQVALAESDGACTTVSTGTAGWVWAPSQFRLYEMTGTNGYASVSYAAGGSINVGTNATTYLQVNSTNVTTAGASQLVSASGFQAATTAVSHTWEISFCGNGPNGATAIYMSPTRAGNYTDATCDGLEGTTESTQDIVWAPYDFAVGSMECGCNDVAVDAGLTFSLRDDTADVGANMTCTTGAGDGAGFVSCVDIDTAPTTIAAGSAIAMKLVAASGNFTTADCICRVTATR